jgi:hypothetical protein
MAHLHLFEFTDQPWYPQVFREIQTDYLRFVTSHGAGHQNLVPLFERALRHSGTRQIVDLCSGGSGPWLKLCTHLESAGLPVKVTLTDKYPRQPSVDNSSNLAGDGITYLGDPVDALQVPEDLKGMRTLFEGFHHFKPEQAWQILKDAFEKGQPIGIFEASLPAPQGPLIFALSPLMTLLGFFFATPFIRPYSWQRFIWTYLLPIVPLATCWDGCVSFLRGYSPEDLERLTEPFQREDYCWEIGQASTGTPLFVFTYLVGYPTAEGKIS